MDAPCGGLQRRRVEQVAADRGVQPLHQALRHPRLGGAEQQVGAGAQRGDGVHDLASALAEGLHVQRVGDDHAAEAHPGAEQVVEDHP